MGHSLLFCHMTSCSIEPIESIYINVGLGGGLPVRSAVRSLQLSSSIKIRNSKWRKAFCSTSKCRRRDFPVDTIVHPTARAPRLVLIHLCQPRQRWQGWRGLPSFMRITWAHVLIYVHGWRYASMEWIRWFQQTVAKLQCLNFDESASLAYKWSCNMDRLLAKWLALEFSTL